MEEGTEDRTTPSTTHTPAHAQLQLPKVSDGDGDSSDEGESLEDIIAFLNKKPINAPKIEVVLPPDLSVITAQSEQEKTSTQPVTIQPALTPTVHPIVIDECLVK